MQKREKSFVKALVILLIIFVIAFSFSNSIVSEPQENHQDFYSISKEVSLNEMLDVATRYNLLIYTPSDLPNQLELTTIYLKEDNFIAIIVYSAEGNRDYKTSELTIQITPSSSPPTFEELETLVQNSEHQTALEINSFPVLIDEKADVGSDIETREKYGDYILLVTTWIDGMRYMLSCRTQTISEAIIIVENMQLRNP